TYGVAQKARASIGNRNEVYNLTSQFDFARHPLMPSHWMTQGLQASARGRPGEAALPLALVWSNGLFAYVVAAFAAAKLYRRGRPDALLAGTLVFLDPQTRLLIVKDFRTFRRDPAQWAQILIFAGLVFVYFLNSRHFYQSDIGRGFRQGVSLLNLTATA